MTAPFPKDTPDPAAVQFGCSLGGYSLPDTKAVPQQTARRVQPPESSSELPKLERGLLVVRAAFPYHGRQHQNDGRQGAGNLYPAVFWFDILTFVLMVASIALTQIAYSRDRVRWMRSYLVYQACFALLLLFSGYSLFQTAYLSVPFPAMTAAASQLQALTAVLLLIVGPLFALRIADVHIGRKVRWLLAIPVSFVLGTLLVYYVSESARVAVVPNTVFCSYLGLLFLFAALRANGREEEARPVTSAPKPFDAATPAPLPADPSAGRVSATVATEATSSGSLTLRFRPLLWYSVIAYAALLVVNVLTVLAPSVATSPLPGTAVTALYCFLWSTMTIGSALGQVAQIATEPASRSRDDTPMNDLRLRTATKTDQSRIRRLVWQVRINPFGLRWQRFVVAVDSRDRLIGCAQLKPHGRRTLELASVAVHERRREMGVARVIIEELLAQGRRPLYLVCLPNLERFYTRFGFHTAPLEQLPPHFRRVARFSRFVRILHRSRAPIVMRLD